MQDGVTWSPRPGTRSNHLLPRISTFFHFVTISGLIKRSFTRAVTSSRCDVRIRDAAFVILWRNVTCSVSGKQKQFTRLKLVKWVKMSQNFRWITNNLSKTSTAWDLHAKLVNSTNFKQSEEKTGFISWSNKLPFCPVFLQSLSDYWPSDCRARMRILPIFSGHDWPKPYPSKHTLL